MVTTIVYAIENNQIDRLADTHDISDSEAQRIYTRSIETGEDAEKMWENETWWADELN